MMRRRLFVGLDGAGKTAIVSILALRHMPGDLGASADCYNENECFYRSPGLWVHMHVVRLSVGPLTDPCVPCGADNATARR